MTSAISSEHWVCSTFAAEARLELLAAIVVVDAVGEPYPLQIFLKSQIVLALAVALVVGVEVFQQVADCQVILAILVEENVTAPEGSLLQVIDKGFLFQAELVEAVHLIAQHLNICKTLVAVFKIICLLRLVARRACSEKSGNHHD